MDLQSWFAALSSGNVEEVQRLIAAGTDVNMRNNEGQTALHLAAQHGNYYDTAAPLVSALLTAGGDKDARQSGGWTPLHMAIANAKPAVVSALLAFKAQTELQDNEGKAPLHMAAKEGHPEIVKELLAAGADKNVRTAGVGATPLHFAAVYYRPATAEILLAAGADTHAKNKYGQTALDMAREELGKFVSQKASGGYNSLYSDTEKEKKCASVVELLAAANEKKRVSFLQRLFGSKESLSSETSARRSPQPSGASDQRASVRFTTFAEKATQGPADCEIGIGEWDSLYEAFSSKLIASGLAARQVVDLVNERLIGVCPMCRVLSPGKGLQMTNLMRQTSVFVGAPADAYRFLKGHCRTESCPSNKILIFWKPDEDRDAIARLGDMGIVVRPRLASVPPPTPTQVAAIIASVKAANLDRWKSSGEPEAWVLEHIRGWNHNDWLGFLTSLRNSQFWPMDEAAIGQHIEMMRAKLDSAEASVTPKAISFADQLRGVLLQDFRDRPETRTFRDLPQIYAELRPIFNSSKNSATDIHRCIRLCREQLVETPDLDIVYSLLSTLYERDDQSAEALTALNEGLVKCKRVSGLLANLGVYLLHHKSADLCLQSLSKAILAQEPPRKDANPYLYLSYICRVFQMEGEADSMLRVIDSLPNSARLDGSLQQEILSVFLTEVGRLQPILLSQIFSLLANGRIDG